MFSLHKRSIYICIYPGMCTYTQVFLFILLYIYLKKKYVHRASQNQAWGTILRSSSHLDMNATPLGAKTGIKQIVKRRIIKLHIE